MESWREYRKLPITAKIPNIDQYDIFDDDFKKEYKELYNCILNVEVDDLIFNAINTYAKCYVFKKYKRYLNDKMSIIIIDGIHCSFSIGKVHRYEPLDIHNLYKFPTNSVFITYNTVAEMNIENLLSIQSYMKITVDFRLLLTQLIKLDNIYANKLLYMIKSIVLTGIIDKLRIVRYFDFDNNISYDIGYKYINNKYVLYDEQYKENIIQVKNFGEKPEKFANLPHIVIDFIGEPEYVNKPVIKDD